MTMDEVKAIFSEFLVIGPDADWDSVRYQEVEGWDSLGHMALVGELEDRLGIMLDTDDVIEMSSFPEAVRILEKYGVVLQ